MISLDPKATYKIIRFFAKRGKRAEIVKTGITLSEAQAHCNREDTCEDDVWFDGFKKEGPVE